MAAPTMGVSSVDRLARSKRPTVERTEIHIPPAPVFPVEAVTGVYARRVQAVAAFNNALQKWRNDAWSIEAPFVPDAALQADVATLEDTTAKAVAKLDRAAIDIRHAGESITTIENSLTNIDNSITTINNQITVITGNAITGTGIVQANGSNPPTAIMGTPGHVPYWTSVGPPYISLTSPIYVSGTLVGIGTDLPAVLLDVGLAGVTAGVMRLAGSTSGNVTIQPAAIAGTWTLTLPVNDGNVGDMLITDGGGIASWTAPTAVGHAMLSATHTDSVVNAVTRGSLIYGNASPAWDELVIGGAGTVLSSNGTDVSWQLAVVVTPSALTRTDDTNVTITLGGSPTVALLAATSLTLGWTGVLSMARGGTNKLMVASAGAVVFSDVDSLELTAVGVAGQVLTSQAAGTPTWETPFTATPAALTKTDDTNVTLTLGGSPTVALLAATSITLGWTGQLSITRGGTNAATALAAFNNLSPLTTRGDLLTRDATNNIRLGIGASAQYVRSNGTDAAWSNLLAAEITGTLPVSIGGTNKTSWTAGSVIFAGAGGTSLAEDNANFFWDDALNFLRVGAATSINSTITALTASVRTTATFCYYLTATDTSVTAGIPKTGLYINTSGAWSSGAGSEVIGVLSLANGSSLSNTGGHFEAEGSATYSVGVKGVGDATGDSNTGVYGVCESAATASYAGFFHATGATTNYGVYVSAGTTRIAAGTTTVAPLLLASGTNLTTPIAGVMEYNGRFFLTDTDATRRHIVQAVNATKTTAGAPYANDGYAELVINGTTLRVMTTA